MSVMAQQDDLASAVLRPLRAHHAFESCVELLATSIRLGIYPDGSTLPPERELAERMAVSRSTLREAIAALREAGLLTTRRGRGGGSVVDFRPEELYAAEPPSPVCVGTRAPRLSCAVPD